MIGDLWKPLKSKNYVEGVHLSIHHLHIFSVKVKSGACYITGQWGRVQNKRKENIT